ncbi:MAG: deoxynucleoside kinase [Candidatus Krumholzibacteria bacterium]
MYNKYRQKLADSGVSIIAVDGSIGVGKTSLGRLLARHLGGRLIEEKVDDNPFLERFYEDMGAYAFQTQLVFLMNRYKEQLSLGQRGLFESLTIIDYIFARDRIFANVNLSDDELGLYNRIASELEKKLVRPDVVIYLQAASGVLYDRIQLRGKPVERSISKDYLETLNQAFNHFFFNYSETPLLVVNTDSMDFVNNEEHFEDLVARIAEPVKGTELYVPTWET